MSKTWLQIKDGKVVNRIEWDGNTETWQPDDGTMMAPDRPGVQVGDSYNAKTGSFKKSVQPSLPESFTPAQIVAALDAMGVADIILSNADPVTIARFYTATSVLETDDRLVGALDAAGKTIDDLKAAIKPLTRLP